ncbi:MAG TPA: SDR family NAD(P)-dependent oxidoreductase, partial [Woeseiaceae bacterium]
MRIEEAKAVVSGGASGLGLATAERVIAAGGRATLLDVNEEQGAKSAARLGEKARFIRTDIADEGAVRRAVREAADAMSGVTLAVNCAGILLPARVLGREGPLPAESFERSLTVNLLGTFILIKEAANVMQANQPNSDGERGVIVNTASVAAFEGQ